MSFPLDHMRGIIRGELRASGDLSKLTWLKVGGIADWLFCPKDEDDLRQFLINCPKDIPITILGGGSNILVRDGGVCGVVIHIAAHLNSISHQDNIITAGAGTSDGVVARYAAKHKLAGLEFMVTIPGTIGGGLIMNAGCYGREFKDALISAEGFDRRGKKFCVNADELGMNYRHSDVPPDWIFTSAKFTTSPDDHQAIRSRMKEMISNRGDSQPIGVRTGGSTFANPKGGKAWQEIDAAGCRGMRHGDASISDKHCNFLINNGHASAAELEQLGERVRLAVAKHSGVELRWEIKRIGRLAIDNHRGTDANI